jgi:hypothetical protein
MLSRTHMPARTIQHSHKAFASDTCNSQHACCIMKCILMHTHECDAPSNARASRANMNVGTYNEPELVLQRCHSCVIREFASYHVESDRHTHMHVNTQAYGCIDTYIHTYKQYMHAYAGQWKQPVDKRPTFAYGFGLINLESSE